MRRRTMSIPAAWQQTFASFTLLVVVEPAPGQHTSAAGWLPLREFGQRIGFIRMLDAGTPNLREGCRGRYPCR
jgi:hypothetical protein